MRRWPILETRGQDFLGLWHSGGGSLLFLAGALCAIVSRLIPAGSWQDGASVLAIALLILAATDSILLTIGMAIKRRSGRGPDPVERPADEAARKRRDAELNAIAHRDDGQAS